MQACSAVDRALESWICLVASRHFCLAAATPLPEPAVEAVVDEVGDDEEVDDDEELLELPHALRAVAATTSRTRNGERRRIMPRLSRKRPRTGRTARWAGPVQHVASGEERLPVRDQCEGGRGTLRPQRSDPTPLASTAARSVAQRTALLDQLSTLQDKRDPLLLVQPGRNSRRAASLWIGYEGGSHAARRPRRHRIHEEQERHSRRVLVARGGSPSGCDAVMIQADSRAIRWTLYGRIWWCWPR